MDLILDVTGDVVERQELLNGTESVTLEGMSDDGLWTITGIVSWNVGLVAYDGEGDLILARRDGAELFGTLVRADVTETSDADAVETDHLLRLTYEVDAGSGPFEGASGEAAAEATLSGGTFRGRWTVSIASPG